MIFETTLTVPADTSADAPASVEMPLAHGIIHKVEVAFPPGCHNEVLVSIRRALHQVYPTNPGVGFRADAYTISYPTWYPLEDEPYTMVVEGWSPGTSYDHEIVVRLGVLPRDVLEPGREAINFMGRLRAVLFGR